MSQPVPPMNAEYQRIEIDFQGNLFEGGSGGNSSSVMEAYVQQIPNMKVISSKRVSKLAKFKAAGLIGCLNDSSITSTNYKDELYK